MMKMKRVLVVDDEPNIQKAVGAVLADAGFQAIGVTDPTEVQALVRRETFDLVLLDIWMPGLDGHTVLRLIKAERPFLPVIIMSGHASVSTGVEAARQGAEDFMEKPFSTDVLLAKIRRVTGGDGAGSPSPLGNPLGPFLKEISRPQRTLAKSGVLKGKGLHTGEHTGLILSPLPADSGIIFEDMASGQTIAANCHRVESTAYATLLKSGGAQVACVEHLLSTLHAFGIDNVAVKVSKEIPILDGSSAPLCQFVAGLGVVAQNTPARALVVDRLVVVTDPKDPTRHITLAPSQTLEIEYHLELPPEFGNQSIHLVLPEDPDDRAVFYTREIAPARTFGFLEELKGLQAAGLGQGGTLDNFLLLDKGQVLNTVFRLDRELARHKILDIIGDLYLAGAEVRGKVTAHKTGHRHNVALLQTLAKGEVPAPKSHPASAS